MKTKFTALSFSVVLLTACGGDAADNNGLDITINPDVLLDANDEPALTAVNIYDFDSVSLHSRNTGALDDITYMDLNYQAQADVDNVLVRLTSAAEDLDLYLWAADDSVDEESTTYSSEEYIIFNAAENNQYRIKVESYEGSGNFELVLTTLNRETLNLSPGEYLVSLSLLGSEVCNGETYSINNSLYDVVNWKKGYLRSLNGDVKDSFHSAEGTSFTVNTGDHESDDDDSYNSDETYTITVNTETGVLTGSGSGSSTEVDDGDTENCSWSFTLSGRVVL